MHLLIAYFLSNISTKYYENPTMLSRVIAKNVGDVFFETECITDRAMGFACVIEFSGIADPVVDRYLYYMTGSDHVYLVCMSVCLSDNNFRKP